MIHVSQYHHMEASHNFFINALKPAEVMQYMRLLEGLPVLLKSLIQEEITAGNKIVSVSTGWPEPDSIMVAMQRPFSRRYDTEGLVYEEQHDAHYGKEGY